ncbi:hypothetical protein OGAPHI_006384 [Ogataea philodendri]|uniref:Uncharacterized protein n=1 Tax=Ogataea philodendri TaxID=1378263 RepID=A0A9P8T1C8_9ASCO|nr:uncharacterized protein OGAPHI_006384 [Ogataea philodendri]KAH3661536.1 hypothetical protein OGAPHI_006384 [Ogataea philodendri]
MNTMARPVKPMQIPKPLTNDCVWESKLVKVRGKGQNDGESQRAEPWVNRVCLSVHCCVSEKLDDGWGKVGVRVRRNNQAEVDQGSKIKHWVFENLKNVFDGLLDLKSRVTGVDLQLLLQKLHFVALQELGIFWEIGDKEVKQESKTSTEGTFNDINPLPGLESVNAIQIVNSVGDSTTTSTSNRGTTEENTKPTLGLRFGVEVGHDVENSRETSSFAESKNNSGSN